LFNHVRTLTYARKTFFACEVIQPENSGRNRQPAKCLYHRLFFLVSGIRRDDGAGLVRGTPEWFHKTTSGQMSTGTVTGFALAAG
jgi:hypothetical protein